MTTLSPKDAAKINPGRVLSTLLITYISSLQHESIDTRCISPLHFESRNTYEG